MLGNPFFLISACAGSGDIADRCADSCGGGLALLGLGNEREVGVISSTADETQDDEIGYPSIRMLVS